jgi:hypothetical protein
VTTTATRAATDDDFEFALEQESQERDDWTAFAIVLGIALAIAAFAWLLVEVMERAA